MLREQSQGGGITSTFGALWSPGWPGNHVDQADLGLTRLPLFPVCIRNSF